MRFTCCTKGCRPSRCTARCRGRAFRGRSKRRCNYKRALVLRRVQGGPVGTGAGNRGGGAGDLGGAVAPMGNACSRMSFTRRARLPPCLMMTMLNSRHSGWLGMMPRSRQMSAMTAPIGRRRTSAAICAGVGRRARRGSVSAVAGATAGRATRGLGCDGAAGGAHAQTVGAADKPCLQRVGAMQAAGDASEDQRNVGGAEAAYDGGGVREGALPDRGGGTPCRSR